MNRLNDISGRNVLPGSIGGHPINGSTQQITNAAADTDGTITLVSGKSYLVVPTITGGVYLGLANVETAANVMWVAPLGGSCLMHIESGANDANVTVHYAVTVNNAKAYVILLDE